MTWNKKLSGAQRWVSGVRC